MKLAQSRKLEDQFWENFTTWNLQVVRFYVSLILTHSENFSHLAQPYMYRAIFTPYLYRVGGQICSPI